LQSGFSSGTEEHEAWRLQPPKHFSLDVWVLTDLWQAAGGKYANNGQTSRGNT